MIPLPKDCNVFPFTEDCNMIPSTRDYNEEKVDLRADASLSLLYQYIVNY